MSEELKMVQRSDTEQARWLADKIPALGDYAAEAAHYLVKLADRLDALQPAAQPVAWGVFRLVDGEWAIQHPVRFTQCAAESDRKAYANPSLVRVHPLYLSTAAVPEGCIDQVRSALGEARKAFLQLAQMQGRSEDFHALMLSHESQMTRALNSLAAPPAAAPVVPEGMVLVSRSLIGDAIDRINCSLPGWEAHVSALSDALAAAPSAPAAPAPAVPVGDGWVKPSERAPEKPGSYLVMLQEDNVMGWQWDEPIIAEWDFWTAHPGEWTVFCPDLYSNKVISGDVLWWQPLPAAPAATKEA